MPMGFVYVIINPSMPDLVKIGLTINTSEERAKELRTTGVPTKFVVVYDELVSDCKLVERKTHTRFEKFREAKEREFFRMPIKLAIRGLREEAMPFLVPESALKNRCEILPRLWSKFPQCIASNLSSVAIIQVTDSDAVTRIRGEDPTDRDPNAKAKTPQLVLLQSRSKPHPDEHEIIVDQIDLDIASDVEKEFPLNRDIKESAAAFVQRLDLVTLLMTADSLLSEEGSRRARVEYESGLSPELLHPPVPIDPADEDAINRDR